MVDSQGNFIFGMKLCPGRNRESMVDYAEDWPGAEETHCPSEWRLPENSDKSRIITILHPIIQ